MTSAAGPKPGAVADIRHAEWLSNPALQSIFKCLTDGGHDAFAVGGAVRNTLLELVPGDIDLTTSLRPEEIMGRAKAAGLRVYPTGVDHGTVTIVVEDRPVEVTTFRRDVATDGRHAVVAFSDDWQQDARRRDFTINALYADQFGSVFDCVGGLADLRECRVRFIGDARTRIREDYLRILRFFRFTAAYTDGAPDADGLAACEELQVGLCQLSAERISGELFKLLPGLRAGDVLGIVSTNGILDRILGISTDVERFKCIADFERRVGCGADTIVRLASLLSSGASIDPVELADNISDRLRLANEVRTALKFMPTDQQLIDTTRLGDRELRALLFRLGRKRFERAFKLKLSCAIGNSEAFRDSAWKRAREIAIPELPISGADVMARGVPQGEKVGKILSDFTDWWINRDFISDRATTLAKLDELISDS